MNKILTEKININLSNIIGSYLLPIEKKIKTFFILTETQYIFDRLNDHLIYKNNYSYDPIYYENFNNCKITQSNGFWVIRPKLVI